MRHLKHFLFVFLFLTNFAFSQKVKDGKSDLDKLVYFHPNLRVIESPVDSENAKDEIPNILAIDKFKAKYGSEWKFWMDKRRGMPSVIIGGAIPFIPGNKNDLKWEDFAPNCNNTTCIPLEKVEEIAREFLKENKDIFLVNLDELVLDKIGSGPKDNSIYTLRFQWNYSNIPIKGGSIYFIINNGNLVYIATQMIGNISIKATPDIKKEEAFQQLKNYIKSEGEDEIIDSGSILILPFTPEGENPNVYNGKYGQMIDYKLVWHISFKRKGIIGTWGSFIDASNGQILGFFDENIYGRVRGGTYIKDAPYNEKIMPFPWCDIGGGLYSDSNGFFSGDNATSSLNGKYVEIRDDCGPISHSTTRGILDFGLSGGTDCATPNIGGAGNTHSSRTQFYNLNRIKERARTYLPTNAWLQRKLTAYVNLPYDCNAYWSGSAVCFFQSSYFCANTGELPGVSLHEWGHGMDENDGSGDMSAPLETYADWSAILHLHNSCAGKGFFSGYNFFCGQDEAGYNCRGYGDCCLDCSGVRDADWDKHSSHTPWTIENSPVQSCGSGYYFGPCGYEDHCESGIATQALWDLVNRDLVSSPTNLDLSTAWQVAERLWYKGISSLGYYMYWCDGYASDGCIGGSLYNVFLAVDDDGDGVANGTPHASAIFASLNRHNIACGTPSDPKNNNYTTCPQISKPILNLLDYGTSSVTLSWDPVPNATRYYILRNENGCDYGFTKIAEVLAPVTQYTDNGLMERITYYYRIQALTDNDSCFSLLSDCIDVTPGDCKGKITFNTPVTGCSSTVEIKVVDNIANKPPTINVKVWSSYNPSEKIITLYNDPPGSNQYKGFFLTTTSQNPQENEVQVADNAVVYIQYIDDNYCGIPNYPVIATIEVECSPPIIYNVSYKASAKYAEISWNTNKPSNSYIVYDTKIPPTDGIYNDDNFKTSHMAKIENLQMDTTYYFYIKAKNITGYEKIDDNNGKYYSFRTSNEWGNLWALYFPDYYFEALEKLPDGNIIAYAEKKLEGWNYLGVLLKMDENGNMLKEIEISRTISVSYMRDLKITPEGNILLFFGPYAESYQILLFDQDLNLLLANKITINSNDYFTFYRMIPLGNGNILVLDTNGYIYYFYNYGQSAKRIYIYADTGDFTYPVLTKDALLEPSGNIILVGSTATYYSGESHGCVAITRMNSDFQILNFKYGMCTIYDDLAYFCNVVKDDRDGTYTLLTYGEINSFIWASYIVKLAQSNFSYITNREWYPTFDDFHMERKKMKLAEPNGYIFPTYVNEGDAWSFSFFNYSNPDNSYFIFMLDSYGKYGFWLNTDAVQTSDGTFLGYFSNGNWYPYGTILSKFNGDGASCTPLVKEQNKPYGSTYWGNYPDASTYVSIYPYNIQTSPITNVLVEEKAEEFSQLCNSCNLNIITSSLPSGKFEVYYQAQISSQGGIGNISYLLSSGSLPPGLHLSYDGIISGTPTQTGEYNFSVEVRDSLGCTAQKMYKILISPAICDTITISPPTIPGAIIYNNYNQDLSSNGGQPPYRYYLYSGQLPEGINLNLNGNLSGTPSKLGTFNFQVSSFDSNFCNGIINYSLKVNNCSSLSFATKYLPNAYNDKSYYFKILVCGGYSPYNFAVIDGDLPAGLSLSSDGIVSGVPNDEESTYYVKIKVKDKFNNAAQKDYYLTLKGVECPELAIKTYTLSTAYVNKYYEYKFNCSGGAAPYKYEVIFGSLPDGMVLNEDGTLYGIPKSEGLYKFTIYAKDARSCSTSKSFELRVNGYISTHWAKKYGINDEDFPFSLYKMFSCDKKNEKFYCLIFGSSLYFTAFFRLDENGDILWSKKLSSLHSDWGTTIDINSNGFSVIEPYNKAIIKFDDNGTIMWSKKIGFNSISYGQGQCIEASSSSDICILKGANIGPIYTNAIFEINNSGNIIWSKEIKYGNSTNISFGGISKSMDGNYLIPLRFTAQNNYSYVFIIKINSNGELISSIMLSGPTSNTFLRVGGVLEDENYYYLITSSRIRSYESALLLLKIDKITNEILFAKRYYNLGREDTLSLGYGFSNDGNINVMMHKYDYFLKLSKQDGSIIFEKNFSPIYPYVDKELKLLYNLNENGDIYFAFLPPYIFKTNGNIELNCDLFKDTNDKIEENLSISIINDSPTLSDVSIPLSDFSLLTENIDIYVEEHCNACQSLYVTPSTLPAAILNEYYSQKIEAFGGASPYEYQLIGSLPPGLNFSQSIVNSSTVLSIYGTPTQVGIYNFSIKITDSEFCSTTINLSIEVKGGYVPSEVAGGAPEENKQYWPNKDTHSWHPNPEATSYRVYRGTKLTLPNLLNSEIDSCLRYEGPETSFQATEIPGLAEGYLYWYLVTGVNQYGEGTAGFATGNIERKINSSGNCQQ